MSASVARSERILNRLAAETGLSAPAVEWLKTALDPFHDTPLNCTGVPDSVIGNSVVQCIKSSVNISAPTGLAPDTNWAVHVQMEPFFANSATPLQFVAANQTTGNVGSFLQMPNIATDFRPVYPVNILSYPDNDVSDFSNPFVPFPSTAGYATTQFNLNANYTDGDYRVVSQGFEVLNTTADLTRQGLCTVYRTPVPTFLDTSVANFGFLKTDVAGQWCQGAQVLVIDGPPANINDALKLPNTKQWKASEGCYVTAHINDCDIPVNNNSWVQPLVQRLGSGGGVSQFNSPRPSVVTLGDFSYPSFREISWAPMDISGAFFTGLSPSTTLTINWNIYIERFPSKLQGDLVVIAKPSPNYCPMAFELYKAIAMELPVGVMQKENGLGDWFRDAVNTVSEIVTPVMSMIPHPAAQAISGVSRAIGNATARKESMSPYVSESAEREFVSPFKAKKEIPRERIVKKEIKKEIKRETKPFLKKSKMTVMPSAKKGRKK